MVIEWRSLIATITGANHKRLQLPNQDAIEINHSPLIIAVADGHGGANYPYSDLGAQFAVKAAIQILTHLFTNEAELSLSQIKRWGEESIPKILHLWQQQINDYCDNSLTIQHHDYREFGSTLLITLILSRCILYWQLGDGEIIILTTDQQLYYPIPKDQRLIANQTTSLSSRYPWQEFRFYFQPLLTDFIPEMIVLSTDGYPNAFSESIGFEQAIKDIYQFLQLYGEKWVNAHLIEWLNEASIQGSGDDITLALIYRSYTP
ncbi:MAG: hypothetical protein RL637_257 [Pseudomonadota bacterium]|jgi:serine/threonine protein phosphatase PrpC